MKIVFTQEIEKIKEYIGNGLDKFNSNFNKNIIPFENKKEFGFYAYDGDTIIGGIQGNTDMGNWVWVSLLFVDEKYRGKDVGTALINEVESYARDGNYLGVHLNTWSWQAKGFYEKMGFTKYGELNNHPKDDKMYWLKKEF